MADGANSAGYVWICVDDIPHDFRSIDTYADFKEDPPFGIKDIFLCLANLHNSLERLRILEKVIQDWCSNADPDDSDIAPLKMDLIPVVGNQYAKLFASYIHIFFRKGDLAENIFAWLETTCMVADRFASLLCAPNQICPSGMENRDIVAAMIGTLDDSGGAFKLRYRPVMGYCGDKFTYLNSVIFENITSIVNMAAISIIKDGSVIRKCQNCGEYFVPTSRSDEIYCDKVLPNGKTCKTVGYDEKIKHDNVLREYRRIYKTQNARKQRNSHKKNISERFQEWVTYAKEEVSRCQSGEISLDEMVEAISSDGWMR